MLLATLSLLEASSVEANESSEKCTITENCLGCGSEAQFAYFYTTTPQTVAGSTVSPPVINFVDWSQASSLTQDDIHLDADTTKIVVKKPGIYDITYTVTGFSDEVISFQVGLYLNGVLVPGSTFGAEDRDRDDRQEVVGPVLVKIDQKNSFISLGNQDTDSLELVNVVGGTIGPNVVASIKFLKVAPLKTD